MDHTTVDKAADHTPVDEVTRAQGLLAARRGPLLRGVRADIGHDRGVNELKERLRADLTDAMRSRDQVRLRTIRMALSSITNEEVSGSSAHELSDDALERAFADLADYRARFEVTGFGLFERADDGVWRTAREFAFGRPA